MKKNKLQKTTCVFLIVMMFFSITFESFAATTKISVSKEIKEKFDKGDIVFSRKAKDGIRGKFVKNPSDKLAGWVWLIPIIAGVGAIVAGEIIRENNMERKKMKETEIREKIKQEYEKALIGEGISDVSGEIIEKVSEEISKKIFNISFEEGVSPVGGFLGLIGAGMTIIEYGPDVLEALGYAWQDLQNITKDISKIIESNNLYSLNFSNPIENTPQTIAFTETFSGYLSATPDYFLSPGSNITFSNLEGQRTGTYEGNIVQNMSGRFDAREGWANTIVNAPINGYVSGNAVVYHNRPINCIAQLILNGILDFKSAIGPFTINTNGSSYGTFRGNTFDIFDPNHITGDVVLYYNARFK